MPRWQTSRMMNGDHLLSSELGSFVESSLSGLADPTEIAFVLVFVSEAGFAVIPPPTPCRGRRTRVDRGLPDLIHLPVARKVGIGALSPVVGQVLVTTFRDPVV